MLSLFRRNPAPQPPTETCNDRIRKFWKWFQEVAPSYHAAIEAGNCDSLTEPTSEKVNQFFPGFGWTYGPGEGGAGHSLTLTGEGVEHLQLLALHWLSLAPTVEGWTFHAARQAGPIKGHTIAIAGLSIDPKEIWVTPSLNEGEEKFDLTIWHPLWPQIEKRLQWQIVFLFLDEMLGEYGTGWWVGEIRLENDRLTDAFPLEELREVAEETSKKENWKKYPPGECYSGFKVEPSGKSFPRSDLLTLTTATPVLFQEHREAKGKLKDPLENTGADYLYVSIPKDFFLPGQEVDMRYKLQASLDAVLGSQASGRCIGGGMGLQQVYVDLLVFDGQRSLDLIVDTLRTGNFPKGTTIDYFAKEKAGNRIRL